MMAEKLNIPLSTLEQQFKASDPANSSWLSANAGSGKTHVLTQRVIRLMLDGNSPDRIMCLTFTKAAAANMKNRVFETLATWTMMPDAELDDEIEASTGKKPSSVVRVVARQLFARALDTPGGLKIQTIHGFCESLLHQFPLEANVPGHFETIQELEQANLLNRATAEILSGKNPDTIRHYVALIPFATDYQISEGISSIIQSREKFLRWFGRGDKVAMRELYEQFEIDESDTEETLKQKLLDELPISNAEFNAISDTASRGVGKSDVALVENISIFLSSRDVNRKLEALCNICLTKKLELKADSSFATKAVREKKPDLLPLLQNCGMHLIAGLPKLNAPQLLKNSYHLFHLGEAILERYQAMKRNRGMIDFDDQIERAANLLYRSDIQAWIRYRLDSGVDHVLVDEAQDTSPAQWQIINAITDDFHSGDTASRKHRTVFVVGDEKQSIFSFQGAEPAEFDAQERNLSQRVKNASKTYHPGKLTLSFRSTEDVLHAVDTVFENEVNRLGLTQSGEATVHNSVRENHAGEVQVWPLYEKQDAPQTESWLDAIDHSGGNDPAVTLAKRISKEIKSMVGTMLPGMDRSLAFKDILVLVRTRNRFITALTRTMKDDGLAIAGSDRLKLTEHIAVEDMLAIGRAAILPQDDLSLACTLKSLFFNISEENLFALAYGRAKNTSLYQQIIIISGDGNHAQNSIAREIISRFETIRTLARSSSVFEFYARLLGEFDGRKKILARLGSEAEDVLEAFVDETLNHTRNKEGTLESFLSDITKADLEIKREVELSRDEVRILTVHASKGLEAPVVFLVDSCGAPWSERHRPALMTLPSEDDYRPLVWVPSSKMHTAQTSQATERLKAAAEAEYRRLLYVGMTRAADRLIVCGYKGSKDIKHNYWHNMVASALESSSTPLTNSSGEAIGFRWVKRERPPRQMKQTDAKTANGVQATSLPKWLFANAKSDPPLPRPLSPSGASVLIDKDGSEQTASAANTNLEGNQFALKKGNVTHKLLEILPELDVDKRQLTARNYLDKTCSDWTEGQRQGLIKSVFSILENKAYKSLFTNRAKAEVAIAGWVETKLGQLQISGQIDRLIVGQDQIMILDYKTNSTVPDSHDAVPTEYKIQVALYRELVRQVYPDKEIFSALLWTQTPKLMVLPDQMLDNTLLAFNKS